MGTCAAPLRNELKKKLIGSLVYGSDHSLNRLSVACGTTPRVEDCMLPIFVPHLQVLILFARAIVYIGYFCYCVVLTILNVKPEWCCLPL